MTLLGYVAILVAGIAAQQMMIGVVRRQAARAGLGAGLLVVSALFFYLELRRTDMARNTRAVPETVVVKSASPVIYR